MEADYTPAPPALEGRSRSRSLSRHTSQRSAGTGAAKASLGAIRGALAGTGLSIESIDEIGPHYAPTLRAWRERLSARGDEARALRKDTRFLRAWELYFAFSEASFAERTLGDAQIRLTRA